jgi:Homeodomain-like domain
VSSIRRWEERGLGGLWKASGRGAKPKCKIEDMQYVAELLAQETRTYNSSQLVKKLKQERGVDLSSDRLRRLLKKTISMETHPKKSSKKQNPILRAIKQADLDTLKLAEQEGIIDLKYLDEAGFCLWSPVSYSYSPVGEQKRSWVGWVPQPCSIPKQRMEQTKKRYGNRISISILGL